MKYTSVYVSMLWLILAFATALSFFEDAPKLVLILLAWTGGIVSHVLFEKFVRDSNKKTVHRV